MNSYVEALLMEIYFQRCVETGMKPEKVKLFPICLENIANISIKKADYSFSANITTKAPKSQFGWCPKISAVAE